MPRKPISDKPMTPAERTRKHRAKIKAENPLDLKACLREITSLNKKIERQRLSNKRLSQENSKLKADINSWDIFGGLGGMGGYSYQVFSRK
jgi:predicted RNase H-like nuclease (RuvC/YqgF family)